MDDTARENDNENPFLRYLNSLFKTPIFQISQVLDQLELNMEDALKTPNAADKEFYIIQAKKDLGILRELLKKQNERTG